MLNFFSGLFGLFKFWLEVLLMGFVDKVGQNVADWVKETYWEAEDD